MKADEIVSGFGMVVVFLILLVIIGLLLGYPVMWMMNYLFAPTLLVKIFGIAKITFWKAFWFNILVGALVKSNVYKSKNS